MKIRRLLVSSVVAITAVLGAGYGAFEYWVNLKENALPRAVTQAKLTEITAADLEPIDSLSKLLAQSPLPWHHSRAQQFKDLLEVTDTAQQTFSSKKVNQLQVGQLLTLQQELENYIRRYPNQSYAAELQQELPAIRSMVTFFPIIKSSAGERSVDSALRASRRGATLAALVIRRAPEVIADSAPVNTPATTPAGTPVAPTAVTVAAATPVATWSKAENDVLYDFSQALQPAERDRISNDDRLKIGRQVCSWLNSGQGYWGVRSLFDGQYKAQVAGNYSHNRDVYIRFSTERLCPQYMSSLAPPAIMTQIAQTPAPEQPTSQPTSPTPWTNPARWAEPAPVPQYGQGYPAPYIAGPPGGVVPTGPFPGNIR